MILGALGTRGRADIDDRGALQVRGETWSVDWWIGADDRWRVPAHEVGVRTSVVANAPVQETRARVPNGDAVQRAYGIGGPGGLVVVEVENDSPAAFVVAFVVREARAIELDRDVLVVDGRPALVLPFAPPRWTLQPGAPAPDEIGTETGPMPTARDRSGRLHAALLYPLSHRNRLRIALATSPDPPGPVDLALVPTAERAARGWATQLGRGMRTLLPDEPSTVDLDRTQILLDPDPDAAATAALEDWGFDEEAAWAWRGLSGRERRRARARTGFTDVESPGARLVRMRAALVRDSGPGLDLLPDPDPAWRGRDLEVHDAPTRHGLVGFALRWHGPRPALLWEVQGAPPGLVVRVPALDPTWSTTAPTGEVLLDPPATSVLASTGDT